MAPPPPNKSILLVITGSIAAYKCAELVRRLRDQSITVKCVMTKAAQEFITPMLMASLSQNEVYTDLWSLKDETEMGHIRLSREADFVIVAPASANTLAKLARGVCDDLASTLLMATDKPVIVAPAMNPMMWLNDATQDNVTILQQRGIEILLPAEGDMACGETGPGRMVEVEDILCHISERFQLRDALKGLRAIVTSGPTYEAIDPVRFIGNFSSGKQGYAIAHALALAGAETVLISGPCHEHLPAGVKIIRVISADEMLHATQKALPADIVVCAAAVSDWRPETVAADKIKKGGENPRISLVENKDILKTISEPSKNRPQLVIGFAAETTDILANARKKLLSKKCDWILANDVSAGQNTFGGDFNTVHLLQSQGSDVQEAAWPRMSKKAVALKLVGEIITTMKRKK